MNEQIRRLADKIWAEEYWNNPNTDKLLPARLNKFAELIVRECMDLLEDYTTDINVGGIQYNVVGASETLQEHFGIEE